MGLNLDVSVRCSILKFSPSPFLWQIPEERQGFGLPRPAPVPFVQPYYYPLEK
ncbi:MAG: hypothetical protein NZ805_05570 [Armatimonadetes bacterium]|nr:hypothetical protein [Armatimonadota bacterium]